MASEKRKEAFLRAWFDVPEGVHWAHGMSNEIEQNVCDCFDKAIAAWTTPVAPVSPDATGKCGELETIGFVPPMFAEGKGANYNDIFRSVSIAENYTAVVTRSQAEELLAAERAENTRLQSENDAQADQISELQMTPWPEWATKVLAVIRKRSDYDGYGDAIEGVDLPAELDECIAAIEADNAAQAARIKELEADLKTFQDGTADLVNEKIDAEFKAVDLEAKLATAQKALEPFAKIPVSTVPEGRLGHVPDKHPYMVDLDGNVLFTASDIRKARAALGGKPS